MDDPTEVEEVADNICIFDDLDAISKKKVKDATYDILNKNVGAW